MTLILMRTRMTWMKGENPWFISWAALATSSSSYDDDGDNDKDGDENCVDSEKEDRNLGSGESCLTNKVKVKVKRKIVTSVLVRAAWATSSSTAATRSPGSTPTSWPSLSSLVRKNGDGHFFRTMEWLMFFFQGTVGINVFFNSFISIGLSSLNVFWPYDHWLQWFSMVFEILNFDKSNET